MIVYTTDQSHRNRTRSFRKQVIAEVQAVFIITLIVVVASILLFLAPISAS